MIIINSLQRVTLCIFLWFLLMPITSQAWQTVVDYQTPSESQSKNQLNTNQSSDKLSNCLCGCALPGTNFSCSYDTTTKAHSPSCRNLANGPCLCVAYGCVRKQMPADSQCTQKCYEKYPDPPPAEECDPLTANYIDTAQGKRCVPKPPPIWWPNGLPWMGTGQSKDLALKIPDTTLRDKMAGLNVCYAPVFSLLQNGKTPGKIDGADKIKIFKLLLQEGYTLDEKQSSFEPGTIVDTVEKVKKLATSPGDVLLVGFGKIPYDKNNPKPYSAPHYVVMSDDNYIFQVMNWKQGYIDEPRKLEWLFDKRDVSFLPPKRKVGEDKREGPPYRTYILMRKP